MPLGAFDRKQRVRIWVSELPPRDAMRSDLWAAGMAASEVLAPGYGCCSCSRPWFPSSAHSCSFVLSSCKTFSAPRRARRTFSAAHLVASAGVRVRSVRASMNRASEQTCPPTRGACDHPDRLPWLRQDDTAKSYFKELFRLDDDVDYYNC